MEVLKNENAIIRNLKGFIISFLVTIICLIIFATLLVYTNLSENTIKPVIITITGISIIIGSSISTRKLKKNGLLNGLIIGTIYIMFLYFLSSIINNNFKLDFNSILIIVTNIICGMLGGIIGINIR